MRRVLAFVWGLVAVDLVLAVVTYSRVPARELYHVSRGGIAGGLSRALVEANFPAALIALGVLLVVAPRPRAAAVAAGALCLVVAVPGVVSPTDLDAKWVNAVPALGVLLAVVLSLRAAERPARPWGWRVLPAVLVVLACAAWIAAAMGLFLDVGFQSSRIVSFHDAPHHAVHHGIHHGWQGMLLILSALALSRLPFGRAAAAYLALMLAYGAGNIVNDGWLEQVAERGWTSRTFPDVLQPRANWGWAAVLGAAAVLWAVWLRPAVWQADTRETRQG